MADIFDCTFGDAANTAVASASCAVGAISGAVAYSGSIANWKTDGSGNLYVANGDTLAGQFDVTNRGSTAAYTIHITAAPAAAGGGFWEIGYKCDAGANNSRYIRFLDSVNGIVVGDFNGPLGGPNGATHNTGYAAGVERTFAIVVEGDRVRVYVDGGTTAVLDYTNTFLTAEYHIIPYVEKLSTGSASPKISRIRVSNTADIPGGTGAALAGSITLTTTVGSPTLRFTSRALAGGVALSAVLSGSMTPGAAALAGTVNAACSIPTASLRFTSRPLAGAITGSTGLAGSMGTNSGGNVLKLRFSVGGITADTLDMTEGQPIALTVNRNDGLTSEIPFGGGIVLQPGQLFASEVATKGRLLVNGVEVGIYAEALSGTHPDGSLRSVFVAFPRSGTSTTGEFRLVAPTVARIADPTAGGATPWLTRGKMVGIVGASSPTHLRACNLVPEIPPALDSVSGLSTAWATWRTRVDTFSNGQGASIDSAAENAPLLSMSNSGISYYDGARNRVERYIMTGSIVEARRAAKCVYAYVTHRWTSFDAGDTVPGGQPDEAATIDGVVLSYWLTGWTGARNWVAEFAQAFRQATWTGSLGSSSSWVINTRPASYPNSDDYREPRIQARILHTMLAHWRLGCVNYADLGNRNLTGSGNFPPPFTNKAELESYIDTVLGIHLAIQGAEGVAGLWVTSQPDGTGGVDQFPATTWQSAQINFYTGITFDTFDSLLTHYTPLTSGRRSSIASAITATIAPLRSRNWLTAQQSYAYADAPTSDDPTDYNYGAPGLNGMFLLMNAMEYVRTGDVVYRTRCDELLNGMLTQNNAGQNSVLLADYNDSGQWPLAGVAKNFNQATWAAYRAAQLLLQAVPQYEGLVELPGIRMTNMRAVSDPVPNFPAISLRVTAASGSATDINSAIATAAALTGGPRLVIVPDGGSRRIQAALPTNAAPEFPIYIAPVSVANGTVTLVRGRRMKATESRPWMPVWETTAYGADQSAVIVTPWGTGSDNYHIYGIEIRVWASAPGDSFCYQLIDHGGHGTDGYSPPFVDGGFDLNAMSPSDAPDGLYISHCVLGGRAFDAAGNWRQLNLGRTMYCNAGRNAIYDSDDIEHGAQGSAGADRGIWGGVSALGPSLMSNVSCDYGGGINIMHGGQDTPNAWPNHADHIIEDCHFRVDGKYIPGHPDHVLGTNGIGCLWSKKNQSEVKSSQRVWWRRNVFDGHIFDGQSHVIVLKAVNQDGRGRDNPTSDIAFTDNIIRSRYIGSIGVQMRSTLSVPDNQLDTVTRDAVWSFSPKYASPDPRPAPTLAELGTAQGVLVQYAATDSSNYADWSYTHTPGVSQWVRYRYLAGETFKGIERVAIRRNVTIAGCEFPATKGGPTNAFRGTAWFIDSASYNTATPSVSGRDIQWNDNLYINANRAVSNNDDTWWRVTFKLNGVVDLRRNVQATECLYSWTSETDNAFNAAPSTFTLPSGTPDQSDLTLLWNQSHVVTSGGGALGGWGDFGTRTNWRTPNSIATISGTGLNRTVTWVSGRPTDGTTPAGPPDLPGMMSHLALVVSGNLV